jgi:hypothetical protein
MLDKLNGRIASAMMSFGGFLWMARNISPAVERIALR